MANITVTEILGTDSMNNSRVTINNNFNALATAVNDLMNVVTATSVGTTNTALAGSSLTIGSSNEIVINSSGIHIGTTGAVLDEELLETIINFFNNVAS